MSFLVTIGSLIQKNIIYAEIGCYPQKRGIQIAQPNSRPEGANLLIIALIARHYNQRCLALALSN